MKVLGDKLCAAWDTEVPMNPKQPFPPEGRPSSWHAKTLFLLAGCAAVFSLTFPSWLPAQTSDSSCPLCMLTYHNDNFRTGQNINETILTPVNVNSATFGKLFSYNVDGFIVGQPLYLPNVSIPGAGTHNVVYVATQHDSVYAFDADSNLGNNATPLWQVSFINPSAGVTTTPIADQGCGDTTFFTEIGITATPVIDPMTGTIYLLAKTKENGSYVYRLHALDVTTGQEKFGGPVVITGSVPSSHGTYNFSPLPAMSRVALLELNGVVYIGIGSNGCDGGTSGWVIGYDAATLNQVGVFNAAPNYGTFANIWMGSAGLAADAAGYMYFATANGPFDANSGGSSYGESLVKLSTNGGLTAVDYFTPYNYLTLSNNDRDLGSGGVLLLPDQPGPFPHLMVAAGKEGTIYLVNRDNMGHFHVGDDSQIVQSLPDVLRPVFGMAAYWNNTIYFAAGANSDPRRAYSISGGLLSLQPTSMSTAITTNNTPSVSANGTTNGIVWVGGGLDAYDATDLSKLLYSSTQAHTRDTTGPTAHFVTPTVINGHVYLGTTQQLLVYGLLPTLAASAGNNQSAAAGTVLPISLAVKVTDSYAGNPVPGISINFSDGSKGGTFSNTSATTDGTGTVTTTYTLPKKLGTFTLTAASSGLVTVSFTETAVPGAPASVAGFSGAGQKAPVSTSLPLPLVAKVTDSNGNGVPGTLVSFSDGGVGGSFSALSVTSDSAGKATVTYTTATKPGNVIVKASVPGLTSASFAVTVVAGPPASLSIVAGNNQIIQAGSTLPQSVQVKVKDAYSNSIAGVLVSFSDGGVGGSFSPLSATSNNVGVAFVSYTTPLSAGLVSATASVSGGPSVTFSVTVRLATALNIGSGNQQIAAAGSKFLTPLGVLAVDGQNKFVPGVAVTFSSGGGGGTFSANPVITSLTGNANLTYTAPTLAGKESIIASAVGASQALFTLTVAAGPATSLIVVSGNNQTGPAGSALPQPLIVSVSDTYGNAVQGVSVTFSDGGAGGTFNPASPKTSSAGQASTTYTTPKISGWAGTVTATAAGVSPVLFSVSTE
jgi:protocatechuate 3,4-dioxygenase beta subunit